MKKVEREYLTKMIKQPTYKVRLGVGFFMANDVCPVCHRDGAIYFDSGEGRDVCSYCDYKN